MPLSAQHASGQTDSLVRLLNARSLEQVETDGRMARKAIEPTFLHNGTYLSCDTALWHVDEKLINCYGNVQLLQGESVLTSQKLDYLIDANLAQFRGGVVELRNQRDNVLRTHVLDYNTQDSLAFFSGGAAMISSDGQIIESDEGTYDNGRSLFTFNGNVNMFTDSVFVRTSILNYDSNAERADFLTEIDFWKDGNMLSAGYGWYERNDDIFFFRQRVHGLGETSESWSDSLYYYRRPNDLLMLGNVQVQDQSRKVAAMGDRLHYVDSLARVTLDQRASAALWDDGGAQADTTYLGAERFIYWTQPRCEVDSMEVKLAQKRRDEMLEDPIAAYRRRAAEDAAKRREEAMRDDPLRQAAMGKKPAASDSSGGVPPEPPESLRSDVDSAALAGRDSTLVAGLDSTSFAGLTGEAASQLRAAPDSSGAVSPESPESLRSEQDTTKIGFLLATKDIRIFRKDMQVRCDSLRYSDLDSIARLYTDPIVWNEGRRQYNSDSLFVLLRNEKMERANLLSNAFIHTEESDGYFDQIKSTDVIAYFNDSTALCRFDALGGVTALLYLEENESLATVNRTESRMMMATFDAEGNVDHVYNYDNPKSDAYPIVQLPESEHRLRGFNWQPDLRPKDKFDVTSMVVRDSEREAYEARPHAGFPQTEIYFPGHMKDVYKALEDAKAKRNARQAGDSPDEPASQSDALSLGDVPPEAASPLRTASDSSGGVPPEPPESLRSDVDSAALAGRDSTQVAGLDSTSFAGSTGESPADTTYMSERELKKALRIARRDARWAELDQRDLDKAARKEARKAARKARRAAREAAHQARQAAIDEAKLQKYIERYNKQKERHEGRKQKPEPAGERPPGIEAGGELQAPPESE